MIPHPSSFILIFCCAHSTPQRCDFSATNEEIRALYDTFGNEFAVPDNFERTAPAYKPNDFGTGNMSASTPQSARKEQLLFSNPQTELICAMLDLVNPNALLLGRESYSFVELSSQLESKHGDEVDEEDEESNEEENEGAVVDDSANVGEAELSELDGTAPLGVPLRILPHEDRSQSDLSWVSHAEYDPLHSMVSSPSHPLLHPRSPPESSFALKQQLSVSHNPEEVNLDELDDDDDDDGSSPSPSAVYTTEAYSPQPLDSAYQTGMTHPVYGNPNDIKENIPVHSNASTYENAVTQSSPNDFIENSEWSSP